jgi:hypothetical protein
MKEPRSKNETGSHEESVPPDTWIESGQTPTLGEVSK